MFIKVEVVFLVFAAVVAVHSKSLSDSDILQRALDILSKKQTDCPVDQSSGVVANVVDNNGVEIEDAMSVFELGAAGCVYLAHNIDTPRQRIVMKFSPTISMSEIRFKGTRASSYKVKVNGRKYGEENGEEGSESFQEFSMTGDKSGVSKVEIIPTYVSGEAAIKKLQICP